MENRVITKFRLVGLNKCENGISATCEPIDREDSFNAAIEKKLQDGLWDYCEYNWNEKKYALIEHDGLDKYGIPINKGIIKQITLT